MLIGLGVTSALAAVGCGYMWSLNAEYNDPTLGPMIGTFVATGATVAFLAGGSALLVKRKHLKDERQKLGSLQIAPQIGKDYKGLALRLSF